MVLQITFSQHPHPPISPFCDAPPFSCLSCRAEVQLDGGKWLRPSIRGGPSQDTAHKEQLEAPQVITPATQAHFVFINS